MPHLTDEKPIAIAGIEKDTIVISEHMGTCQNQALLPLRLDDETTAENT